MGYLFLLLTIIFETTAVLSMKLSAGFKHTAWTTTAVITYLLSFICLTLALRQLNAGVANAIWAGTSTLLVAILGYFLLHEKLTIIQWISIGLIVLGLVGITFQSGSAG